MTTSLARDTLIDRADVFVVRSPIDPPSGVSIGLATSHEYVLVRLADHAGRVGWGETYLLPGVEHTVAGLARSLLGADPAARRVHRRTMASTRTSSYARSALLIALDDLHGRQAGLPVHRIYGGPTRGDVAAYAASQGYVEGVELEQTWHDEAERAVAAGFTALKLRIGRFDVDREIAALEAVRAALPGDVHLMVDGNGGYTVGTATRMGHALARLGARWFEEPLPQTGYPGYPELTARLDVPVAGGEILESAAEAAPLLAARFAAIVQPEVVICGGIDGALAIADLAALHGIPVVPHTSGGAIGIAATLQLLACIDDPHGSPAGEPPLLEYGQGVNPWRTDILREPLVPVAGRLAIPDGPGLGVDVDEDVVRASAELHLECA